MAQEFSADSLPAPVPDSLRRLSESDSVRPRSVPMRIGQWPVLNDGYFSAKDSLLAPAFRFKDLLFLNYTGLADVFRLQPGVQVYDFLEMSLPRYVAPLHRWPQQNTVECEGIILNDPLSGMFNTRLFFPDALQFVRLSDWSGGAHGMFPVVGQSADMTLVTRALNPEEPYSRIMYREGDFGYSDLDITFARRLGEKYLIQLGGINRDYDPNFYRGTHYRGRLTFAPANRYLAFLSYRKSSENVTFADRYGLWGGPFRRNEVWEWYAAELKHLTPDLKEDWRIGMFFDDARRHYRFASNTLHSRLGFNRLVLQARKKGHYRKFSYETTGQAQQVQAWGSVYDRLYTDSRLTLQSMVGLSLPDSLFLAAGSALRYQWDQALQWEPYLRFWWMFNNGSLRLKVAHRARFPTLHERFFNFQQIKGKRSLPVEEHEDLTIAAQIDPVPWIQNSLSLTLHAVRNEILFNGTAFFKGRARRFVFAQTQSAARFYKFQMCGGGQIGLSGTLLGPRYSAFAQLRYHDRWIHGHLIVDATGTIQYWGPFKNIAYQPYAEYFYRLPGEKEGVWILTFKIVGTVKDAHLFMEMDNPFGWSYQIIDGYPEIYRRVRFGVSWVLWN